MSFIDTLKGSFPQQEETLNKIEDYYNKKLWHQLSIELETLIKRGEFQNEQIAQDCYNNFLSNFETKLRPIRLASIVVQLANQFSESQKAVNFLDEIAEKVKEDTEAWCVLKSNSAIHLLKAEQTKEAQQLIENVKKEINGLANVDNLVNSAYYKAYALWLKTVDKPSEFFRNALLYLAYTPAEEMSIIEQKNVAFDLGIAALIAEDVYNFGELLRHPAVESLSGTQNEWLLQMLKVFNRGNIPQFNNLTEQYKKTLSEQPVLSSKSEFLREKIRLMSLMELVFQRGTGERILSFQEVSDNTGVPVENVEVLLLKALALDLIRGKIDEIDSKIHVNWVQPRVLDTEQVASIRDNIGNWIDRVHNTLVFLENETPELFA
eukprot:gb/GECH01008629.1/.p1 GENE.gb/GECH01008629.1/~~gb/GECH01008629.1/.p1  ORF type:complete len:378 (+),score=121.87 gb/GECH01008629.1/:1-1134(+)